MALVKSLSVGNGDMFYIRHNSDNFTIIDCCLTHENQEEIVAEIKAEAGKKGITRFISTHPDEDHFQGLPYLDDQIKISNFYCVENEATKDVVTESFERYCELRDDSKKAYYVYKGCKRRWMNQSNDERKTAGIAVLWPDRENADFKQALQDAADGIAFNNISLVCRYSIEDGASFLWIGDLETEFMESIVDDIELTKTTVVFAPHHGRNSGKIPDSWLVKLDPQVIVIGEAPSRHLNYYTGYEKITQNKAWDITFDAVDNKVHMYVSNPNYGTRFDVFDNEYQDGYDYYIGSITVETEYTL
ncbi:metallo-beta-lactamase superfamily protein [Rhizobium subbaraonis]|uniref:Metallo-beta-lactamase superfamily protein n=1 Tax=Rhizobium subbaraonis TaxID=908946 RepID=A0A285V226_9HYPH|nr:MBL fold metallo-hydrolase [Rhizobium subbaraonis]SOC48184.1 metallo-beta-lactamase superfamily protein [Rhizobium subbaraonis]